MATDTNEPFDLDVDFSAIDTGYPVLPEGLYRARIVEARRKENKDKTGHNVVVVVELTQQATSLKGKAAGLEDDVQPGLKLTAHHPLQDKEGSTQAPGAWKKNLAQILEATIGKDQRFNSAEIEGREVYVRLGVETYEGEAKNSIKSYKKIED